MRLGLSLILYSYIPSNTIYIVTLKIKRKRKQCRLPGVSRPVKLRGRFTDLETHAQGSSTAPRGVSLAVGKAASGVRRGASAIYGVVPDQSELSPNSRPLAKSRFSSNRWPRIPSRVAVY
jgi:hypothetical protein